MNLVLVLHIENYITSSGRYYLTVSMKRSFCSFFRPRYRSLLELKNLFPGTPLMALTGTATKENRQRLLKEFLRGDRSVEYWASVDVPHIEIACTPVEVSTDQSSTSKSHKSSTDLGNTYCDCRVSWKLKVFFGRNWESFPPLLRKSCISVGKSGTRYLLASQPPIFPERSPF